MLLEIEDLHLSYKDVKVLCGASLAINRGEVVGLVGPSGCGKSTIAKAIMDLLPHRPQRGKIAFNGEDLLQKTPLEMEEMRGNEISLINQNVMTSLHPTKTIGAQILETIRYHKLVACKEQVLTLLEKVKLPTYLYDAYPHTLSGGMRQRAMIAMAISCWPQLLIADEPTTALDVTIQAQIIALLQELNYTTLFITHDLKLVAGLCDKVFVMDEGKIIESGSVEEIFYTPHHPVTQKLLTTKTIQLTAPSTPLLKVESLSKLYLSTTAVEKASFTIHKGETVGLIGESGCGKSTLGKMVAGLLPPTSGKFSFTDNELAQMVFQDPYGSLNPKMRVKEIVQEGLTIHRLKTDVTELLSLVQLPDHILNRYPHELSGGERQRVGIARALSVQPKLLICDEPLSSLDTMTQMHLIDLFLQLQKQLTLSYLFISHDLLLVKQITHRLIVMYRGRIVEMAPTVEIFKNPKHPYTQALLASIPETHPRKKTFLIQGDLAMHSRQSKGCVFQDRCPRAHEKCKQEAPELKESEPAHFTACHLSLE